MTIFFNTGLRFNGEKAAFCTHIPVETQIANDIYIEKLSLPKKNCFVSTQTLGLVVTLKVFSTMCTISFHP